MSYAEEVDRKLGVVVLVFWAGFCGYKIGDDPETFIPILSLNALLIGVGFYFFLKEKKKWEKKEEWLQEERRAQAEEDLSKITNAKAKNKIPSDQKPSNDLEDYRQKLRRRLAREAHKSGRSLSIIERNEITSEFKKEYQERNSNKVMSEDEILNFLKEIDIKNKN